MTRRAPRAALASEYANVWVWDLGGWYLDSIRRPLPVNASGDRAAQVAVCPFFGLKSNPQVAARYPREDGRCQLTVIPSPVLEWQSRFCVVAAHQDCPYFRAHQEGWLDQSPAVPASTPVPVPVPVGGPAKPRRKAHTMTIAVLAGLIVVLGTGLAVILLQGMDSPAASSGSEATQSAPLSAAALSPEPTRDVPTTPAPQPSPSPTAHPSATSAPTAPVAGPAPTATSAAPQPSPTSPPAARSPTPTQAAAAFQPTHRLANSGAPVNLRAGPAVTFPVLQTLIPGTPLRYLEEQQQAADATWLHFETQNGLNGWIRSVDVVLIVP